jgi:ABC-type Mn2+/Zn2+ transport system permease subunit
MELWLLVALLLITATSGYLGSLLLGRRLSLIAGPMGHLTLPGVAIALALHLPLLPTVFVFITLTTVLIFLVFKRTQLPLDVITAVFFVVSFALAIPFFPLEKVEDAFAGNVKTFNVVDVILVFVVAIAVLLFLYTHYDRLTLLSINKDLAYTLGIGKREELLYVLSLALIITLSVKLVGGLLTIALTVLPAVIAQRLSSTLKHYQWFSLLIPILTTLLALPLSNILHLRLGPVIIVVYGVLFLLTLFYTK